MTGPAITFDTGALIALEGHKERAVKVHRHAKDRGLAVAAPNVTLAEWWRGRTDRREAVLRGLLVEPVSNEVMKLAGMALGKVPKASVSGWRRGATWLRFERDRFALPAGAHVPSEIDRSFRGTVARTQGSRDHAHVPAGDLPAPAL